jgi:hypothetical protein
MKATIVTAITMSALALTACSSSSSKSPAGGGVSAVGAHSTSSVKGSTSKAAPPDACRLLTDDQVAQATGATVQSHAPGAGASYESVCVWTLKVDDPEALANPALTVRTEINQRLGSDLDTFGDETRGYTPNSDFGDKAAIGRYQGVGNEQLVFVQDGVVYAVTAALTGHDDTDLPADKTAAGLIEGSSLAGTP